MKNKILVLLFVLALALCIFASCGGNEANGAQAGNQGCNHQYQTTSEVPATCAAEGSRISTCSLCQATKTDVLPKSTTHGRYIVTEEIDATCQAPKKVIKECEVCKVSVTVEEGQKAAHTPEIVVLVEATCDQAGKQDYICTVCNEQQFLRNFEKDIPALGHTYERTEDMFDEAAGVTFVPSSCDVEGYFARVCGDCGYSGDPITREEYAQIPGYDVVKYDEMEAFEHKFTVKIRSGAATCTEGSYEEFACSRENCDATEKQTTGYPKGHKYVTNETAVEDVNYVIDPKPTCMYEGRKTYICTVCSERATDDKYIEVVEKLSHDTTNRDDEYLVRDVAATCDLAAYKVYRCCVDSSCEVTETVYDGEPLPHNWVVNGVQTCKTEGKTPYICDRDGCGKKKLDTPVDEKIKHTYGSVVKEATCINNAVYKCSVCESEYGPYSDDSFYDAGFAHGNHVLEFDRTIAPTCSEIGYNIYSCVADDECTLESKNPSANDIETPLASDIVARLPHTFDADGNGISNDVNPDGKIICTKCFTQYRDITTEITNGNGSLCLGCGKTPCDCGLSVEWNGYVSPTIPTEHILMAGVETTISSVEWTQVSDKGTKDLAIGEGLIILDGSEGTTYTVKVYDKKDGTLLKEYNLTGDVVLIDLYDYLEVGQVSITASDVAIVYLYTIVK